MTKIPIKERPTEEELEDDRQIEDDIEVEGGNKGTEHGIISENPNYMSDEIDEMVEADARDTVFNTIQESTSTAHRLKHHSGECQNTHGHNIGWEVELEVRVPDRDDKMPVDYKDVGELLDVYDHAIILNESDPLVGMEESLGNVVTVPHDPTCEFLSTYVAEDIYNLDEKVQSVEVTIQETDKYATTGKFP